MAQKGQTLCGREEEQLASTSSIDKLYGTANKVQESSLQRGWTQSYCMNRIFKELVEVTSLSWPAVLSSCFTFSLGPISLMFCGRLGQDELAAASLADSILTISGMLLCAGLTSACDTLFSQAYGGKRLESIGVNLQKSVLIVSLACLLCWSLHLNTESLLLSLGQVPEISRLAADYIFYFMPGLIFNFLYQVALKFLQNQNLVTVTAILGLGGNIFNALAQYVLLYVCNQGLNWSWSALDDWGHFLKLGMAGYAVLLTDWCAFDMAILIAGYLGVVEQGAVSAALHLEMIGYMIFRGLGTACCIRVGQNLGAGDSEGAKTSYRVSAMLTGSVMVVTGLTILFLKDVLPWLFTTDPTTADLVSRSIPLLVAVMLVDAVLSLHADALSACGIQRIGAIIQICGYCLISTPAVVILMLHTPAGVFGCWWGLLMGILPMAVAYIIFVNRLDWQQIADDSKITKYPECGATESLLNDHCSSYNDDTESDKPGQTNRSDAMKTLTESNIKTLILKRICASLAVFGIFCLCLILRVFVPVYPNVKEPVTNGR